MFIQDKKTLQRLSSRITMNYMIFFKLIELNFLSSKYSISQCLHYRWAVGRTADSGTFMIFWLGSARGNLRPLCLWSCWSSLEMALRVCNHLCDTREGRRLRAVTLRGHFVTAHWKCLLYSALFPLFGCEFITSIEVQFIPWSLGFLLDAEGGMCGSRQIHFMSPAWVSCVTEQRQCGQ